jgi:hypothetical protein
MTTKILIDVQGGVVQAVFSNNPDVEITLIDWDNIKDGPELELVEQNNYPVDYLDEIVLEEKLEEANDVIRENIENYVEQKR